MNRIIKAFILFAAIGFFKFIPVNCQDSISFNKPSQINKPRLYTTLTVEGASVVGLASYLNYVWYKDHQRVPFHFDNDNKAYLQADKFGHVWGAYMESYIGYKMLRRAGVKKTPALIYGGGLGILLQAPIEIFDGIYDGWGFSWGDMIANTVGSSLVIGQELLFDRQVLKYKVSYHESPYEFTSSGGPLVSFSQALFDYNTHTYWLSVPVNRLLPKSKIPDWVNIAAGYGASGLFGKYENETMIDGVPVPPTERYRKYLLSLDVDWTQIKTNSRFLKAVFECLYFVKLPFPALEYNSKGQFKGYWMYY